MKIMTTSSLIVKDCIIKLKNFNNIIKQFQIIKIKIITKRIKFKSLKQQSVRKDFTFLVHFLQKLIVIFE